MTTATNGKRPRAAGDYYATPASSVVPFLQRWRPMLTTSRPLIVEPCAGGGELLPMISDRWADAKIKAYDLTPKPSAWKIDRLDFLTAFPPELAGRVDLVMSNPPYGAAEAFVRAGLRTVRDGGYVAYLLRLGFLASQRRRELYRRNMPERVYVLAARPSFRAVTLEDRGGGNDNTDYAWYVWRKGRRLNHSRLERLDA